MLSPAAVHAALVAQGVRFFTGVPDSLLKDFCAYVTDHADPGAHVIAANEGNAIALAAGHYLGSGQPALVYMQNSGLGNAVNPLLSLADPEVYGLPMLLLIGWRGQPGVKDEPQHVKQGRVTPALLDAMEIPWHAVQADTSDVEGLIESACARARGESRPVALLASKDCFAPWALRRQHVPDHAMSREQALQVLVDLLKDEDTLVSTTGKCSRELYEYRQARGQGHGRDFLTVGSMGHTSSIAMGLALARPDRRVLCLDGDGSAIMHLGAMAIVGQSAPAKLLHVIFNNGAHDSVGGQPTVGFAIQLDKIARACGYKQTVCVDTAEGLRATYADLRDAQGPCLLEIRVNKGARADLGRPASSPIENRDALMAHLHELAGT